VIQLRTTFKIRRKIVIIKRPLVAQEMTVQPYDG
jgi:hypothetical protein